MNKATYSPEDNKLRIYPAARLDADEYAALKSAGYCWAPKQKLFVAPMWTPSREAAALAMCGAIDDEDSTLAERAAVRADRFEDYSDKRADEAERMTTAVEARGSVVTARTQGAAEREAGKIEQAIKRAANLWETSTYWTNRAAGALGDANYKQLPAVRARRIKGIEADKRKQERKQDAARAELAHWDVDGLTLERAIYLSNYQVTRITCKFTLEKYPRKLPASQYEGDMSLYGGLTGGIITAEQARGIFTRVAGRIIAHADRWINHYKNRLAYECAMLDEQGAKHLIEKKARPAVLPICNYMQADGFDLPHRYTRGVMEHTEQVIMTKAEYSAIRSEQRGTRTIGNAHRVRVAVIHVPGVAHYLAKRCMVFLSDSKTHEPPSSVPDILPEPPAARVYVAPIPTRAELGAQDMREKLAAGVEAISAPQLFPTPPELAARMAEMLDIQPGDRVLEPSAGTGALLDALPAECEIEAVEINAALAERLRVNYPGALVFTGDFMDYDPDGGQFNKIIMNPPFINALDIKHIKHAAGMLAPGGVLVAICAGGPRQRAELEPLASYWEELPAGTFAAAGTNVSTVLLTIEG
jgi:phospholipid N-methyltransferase